VLAGKSLIYIITGGKISFWHDPENGGCFGGFPEQIIVLNNIEVYALMEALGITRIEKLGRLPGHDDVERITSFCEKHNISYDYYQDAD
jgi:hypothetical protein